MSEDSRRVLIVDDDETITSLLEGLISPEAEVAVASTGNRAIKALEEKSFRLIFLDLRMPGGSGHTVIDYLAETRPDPMPRVIVLSAVANENTHLNKDVVTALIRKPFDPTNMAAIVRRYLQESPPAVE